MSWPTTSEGMRSGVNWTRLKSRSREAAKALTSSVLATPGTPSSNTWPRTRRATTRPVTTRSWPTTALATSSRTRRTALRGASLEGTPLDGTAHLPAQHLGILGDGYQRPLVGGGRAGKHGSHLVLGTPDAGGRRLGHRIDCRVGRQPEALRQRPAGAVPHEVGRPAPCVRPLEEAADGRHQLGARDLHWLGLEDRAPETAGAPQGQQDEGDAELHERQLHVRRDEVDEGLASAAG